MTLENKIAKVTKNDTTFKVTVVNEEHDASQIMADDHEELKAKAARAGDAVTDFASSALDRAETAVKTKARSLYKSRALEPSYAAARKDSADIAHLGPALVTELATVFESTDTMACTHSYPEQVQILTGYKKLLEEQINVIDSRIGFVKRVR
jgi:hypothetical protein